MLLVLRNLVTKALSNIALIHNICNYIITYTPTPTHTPTGTHTHTSNVVVTFGADHLKLCSSVKIKLNESVNHCQTNATRNRQQNRQRERNRNRGR